MVRTDAARVLAWFAAAPWLTRPVALPHRLAGMLGDVEEQMFYCLAKGYFAGRGVVVDAGSYLGRSAYAFAQGLRANPVYHRERDRIHCFDMFVVLDDMMMALARDEQGHGPVHGQSTRPVFERQVAPVRDALDVHESDFLTVQWPQRPIEILMVDVAKNVDLGRRIVDLFFPCLLPGVSIVVHQDYHHPWLPHLHVVMEHLADCFDIVAPRVDASAAFLLTKEIPPAALERAREYDFTAQQQIDLMDRAIGRIPAADRSWVELARIVLLLRCGVDPTDVRRELTALQQRGGETATDAWRRESERVAATFAPWEERWQYLQAKKTLRGARPECCRDVCLQLVRELVRVGRVADAEQEIVDGLVAGVAGGEGPADFLDLLAAIWLRRPDAARAVAVMDTLRREVAGEPDVHVLDAKVRLHLGDRAAAGESLRRACANGLPADRASGLRRDLRLADP